MEQTYSSKKAIKGTKHSTLPQRVLVNRTHIPTEVLKGPSNKCMQCPPGLQSAVLQAAQRKAAPIKPGNPLIAPSLKHTFDPHLLDTKCDL